MARSAAVCGDGAVQAGEACDDGNTTSGDGCSDACAVEGATPPSLRVDDPAAIGEGNSGQAPLAFSVTRVGTATHAVNFGASTAAASSASADISDYIALPAGTRAILPAGATSTTVSVQIKGDTTFEGSENFLLKLDHAYESGDASFAGKQSFAAGAETDSGTDTDTNVNPTALAAVDLDADGKPDLLAGNVAAGTLSVQRNTGSPGTPSFATAVSFTAGTQPWAMAVADFDADGNPDVVVSNRTTSRVTVLRHGDAATTVGFDAGTSIVVGTGPQGVGAGDIDGDGNADIVVAAHDADSVTVLRNTRTGSALAFTAATPVPIDDAPRGLALGDLDGDGKLDVVVAANAGGSAPTGVLSVLRNTSVSGAASFATLQSFLVDGDPFDVMLGDYDGDGRIDVAVSRFTSNEIKVLRNISSSGSIAFENGGVYPVGGAAIFGVAADIDGDGKPDLAVANRSTSTASVLLNTGSSGTVSFAAQETFLLDGSPYHLAVADFDGDWKPDLAAATTDSDVVSLLRNTQPDVTLDDDSATGTITNDDSPPIIIFPPVGPPPAPGFSAPGTLDFGDQQVLSSQASTLTITNTGNATMTVSTPSVTGANVSDYAVTANTCGSVPASTSCTIEVTFTPAASASRTATLTVPTNAAGSPHSVSLTGTGTLPVPPVTPPPAAASGGGAFGPQLLAMLALGALRRRRGRRAG